MGGTLLLGMADRDGTPTAAVYFDADGFKGINDVHGHQAGDDALREIAAVLLDASRTSDVVGRLGGDEFAMILSDTDAEAAAAVVSRVGRLLDAAGRVASRPHDVSVSAGIAVRAPRTGSLRDLLAAADGALYAARAQRAKGG